MASYNNRQPVKHRLPRRILLLNIAVAVAVILSGLELFHFYNVELRPVSSSQVTQIFTVKLGSPVKLIASNLQSQHLIRSAWAMELYGHNKQLQAGTYALSPSQGTVDIVNTMTKGRVATSLVTILPGRRIDQIRADLINDGFTPDSVDAALMPNQYKDLSVMTYKPANVNTLEGLLWPDSFQKTADTDASVIIRESLVAMGQHLTPAVIAAFATEGLTSYQGLTLTSIIVQEVSKTTDQAQAAQVFLSRLSIGMQLGSDVTANYGAVVAGLSPSLAYDSAYNTLLHTGLPPTPISTVTANGLQAATHPAATNWLYFVAGDNGTTYFSTNLKDHQTYTQLYCIKLCGR